MADNAKDTEAVEVTPELLAASETIDAPVEPIAAAQPKARRGLFVGGSIAAGVLALGLSFGGGYALGHTQDRPDFAHGDMAAGQMFMGGGDRDGDRDGGRRHGEGPGMMQGAPGQGLTGQGERGSGMQGGFGGGPMGQPGQQGQQTAPTAPAQPGTNSNGTTTP